MSDFLQNTNNDLQVSEGNLTIIRDLDLVIAQKLTCLMQLYLGEWFADTRIGMPYYQAILVKGADLNAIGQIFRNAFSQVNGVKSIVSADLNFISTTRTLIAVFSIETDSGAILVGGIGKPFIVKVPGK